MIVALGDLMLDVAAHARPAEDGHLLASAMMSSGGSAANFAVWVARLGAQVGLVSKVGDDIVGRALVAEIVQEGVESGIAIQARGTTGFTFVTIEAGGTRRMLAARGSLTTLSAADVSRQMIERAGLLHVTAYTFFEDLPRQAALEAMRWVKERGGIVSLDPSAAGYLRRVGFEKFRELARDADILLPNLEEGQALTGETDPARIASKLALHWPVIALKLGVAGAMAATGESIVYGSAEQVTVADTTGAGDAFGAAFVVSWLADRDLARAVRAGNHLAAQVVQAKGARSRVGPPGP